MNPVIEIENIGKKYNIRHYQGRYIALRDVIGSVLKHPFKFLKHKTEKSMGRVSTKEDFWALKNVNLSIEPGETVGIIGANGAGKSTLLKILSGITPPTEGEIRIHGKIASLLEVGTGFHPELTGRENIFLNGAILGMPKKEIERKFDQIVEFSGIEKFLDTPVKRYSSGMYVRLAFSVAAHLESDILLVDEVLAVGDAEFQKKCLGKMDEVTQNNNRTILFVSHNMDAISRLCKKTILLDHGTVIHYGPTQEVIEKYLAEKQPSVALKFPVTDEGVTLHDFSITQDGKPIESALGEKTIEISLAFSLEKKLRPFRAGVFIYNALGTVVNRSFIQDWDPKSEELEAGRYTANLSIPARLLLAGHYRVELKLFSLGIRDFFVKMPIEKTILVHNPQDYNVLRSKNTDRVGFFLIPNAWEMKKD
jgi:lipopolysaccharide transport system ATP-binding protein